MDTGRGRTGQSGNQSGDPPVCFRVQLEQWYGLSFTDTIPDEMVPVRVRKNLIKAGIAETLFIAALT